jgi:histidinol dehydrogenase
MAARLDQNQQDFEARFDALLASKREADVDVGEAVAGIISDVRRRGDAAVLDLTAKFDRLSANSVAELAVGRDEIDAALDGLTPSLRDSWKQLLDVFGLFTNASAPRVLTIRMMQVSGLACAIRRLMRRACMCRAARRPIRLRC